MGRHFIPAHPGFFTVERMGIYITGEGEKDGEAVLHPIVAWQVEDDLNDDIAITTPVTTTGTDHHNPIVFPSGRVVKPEEYEFPSVEDWLKYANEEKRTQLEDLERQRKERDAAKNEA